LIVFPFSADEQSRLTGGIAMIELTRLNGTPLFVNCDLIKWAEAAPDTMLTLVHGEKVVVRESCAEVVARITAQRVRLLTEVARMVPDTATLLRLTSAASIPGGPARGADQEPATSSESG
jgi:flagellar protein FlbD